MNTNGISQGTTAYSHHWTGTKGTLHIFSLLKLAPFLMIKNRTD